MSENIISSDVADEQIEALKLYYDIDVDDLPDNVKGAIVSSFKKIKRAIMEGRLEIEVTDDTILVKQTLCKVPAGVPGTLAYKEVSGQSKVAIRDDSTDHGKMYAFMGALCGEGSKAILALKGKDLSLAESLGCVFLQV